MSDPKQIGIAVVEHQGQYLVGVRGLDVPLPGAAEFPGGKCNVGESPFQCVVRECMEETGLLVVPVRLLQQREFHYPHGHVCLSFVLCYPSNRNDVQDRHNQFRWESLEALKNLNFPEGNSEVLLLLG